MCKTAIKAVIYLCSIEPGKAGLKEVAQAIHASSHTIGKILQLLVKQGIINSVKGPSGGFFITPAQQELPIILIVEAIDGRQVFTSCGLGLSHCSGTHPCPIHDDYKKARDIMESLFREKKVSELCSSVNEGLAYLAG